MLKTLIPNTNNKIPYPLPSNKSKSYIRSTSYPEHEDQQGYNEILLEDLSEEEKLFVRAQKDYVIWLHFDNT